MSIIKIYEALIANNQIIDNPYQREILPIFDDIANNLTHGLYLYGEIGVGKTFLSNLLYDNINSNTKLRFHFHDFMRYIGKQLRNLQGHVNPIIVIANNLTTNFTLIYIDEFIISDLIHAKILTQLLPLLIKKKLTLIMTSNIPPDYLYLNGVQRNDFLPTIAFIKNYCKIINLHQIVDYRLQKQEAYAKTYFYPLTPDNYQQFQQIFINLEPESQAENYIAIQNRQIKYIKRGKNAIWFDFNILCNIPRSQLDYLELSKTFKIIFISNIPKFTEDDQTLILLFIYLIDILYDNKNIVIITAAVNINELYTEGNMLKTFQRTLSRLHEMQASKTLVTLCSPDLFI